MGFSGKEGKGAREGVRATSFSTMLVFPEEEGMMHYGTSKETYRNEIELGIEIPTIKYQASNIPMTKGTTYVVMRFDR